MMIMIVGHFYSKFDHSCATDPLVHHGCHFGRTIHALCTVSALLNNGILCLGELSEQPEETFTHESVTTVLFLLQNTKQPMPGSVKNTVYSISFSKWCQVLKTI